MKKLIQKLHLILGLIAGIVIFIVATTGCITSFEEELRAVMYSDLFEVSKPGGPQKNLDQIISIAEGHYTKDKVKGIRVKKDPNLSTEVAFDDRTSVFVDQYSGKVLGTTNRNEDFFGKVLKIHKDLYLDDAGEWITSISALIMLIMIISGIIIWWPKDKKNRKEKFTLKKGVHWKKRNYDLHSVLGFYASWFILFTVLTALIFSFEWAEESMFWLTGSKKEKRMEVNSVSEKTNDQFSIATIYKKTTHKFPDLEECIINLPEEEKSSVRVIVRYGNGGFFKKQDNLFFDPYDGQLITAKLFDELSPGMKTRISCEKIHTGKAFGLVGQWAVFFASLIVASLPITGFLVWWNKRKK